MNDELLHPLECERPYTVAEINRAVAARLESGNTVVWFTGELSNFKQHSSGHCYLRLKDHGSQIPAVIWRTNASRMGFEPEDGMAVTGTATVRVYQKGGYYQLDIMRIQPAGAGALHAAFEKLKARLSAEGLFDESRKREIPQTVCRLGVITSKTGAAIRDIIRVVAQRAPGTDIVLVNTRVQGDTAAAEIAAAIRLLNEQGTVDVIIAGRGGGSIEDLWAFNEETVARAIAGSKIPVISAVGHETDFTIADFCADIRAATPSAAAELAVPDTQGMSRYVGSLAGRYMGACLRTIQECRSGYRRQLNRPGLRRIARIIPEAYQSLDHGRSRLEQATGSYLRQSAARFAAAARHLGALSPLSVLARGYAVVSNVQGTPVVSSEQLTEGEALDIRFSRGATRATVSGLTPPEKEPVQ